MSTIPTVHQSPPPINSTDKRPACNVCGYPAMIVTRNLESGKQEWTRVDCLGHIGVPPYLLNRTKEYERMTKAMETRK